ncbi:MAG: mesaconyl-C4 CoA hydratase [Frankiales bacterium]|nr:mesaconyl-C4 CoA hydratase [Frankiales bacterium]
MADRVLADGALRRTETIGPEPAESLAGLLDLPVGELDVLPPLWHWLHLIDRRPQRELGPDGHPLTGIPAPPGPGRRRMFAGGRITHLVPLVIGAPATKTTTVLRTQEKAGRGGPMTFVTVRQEIEQDGRIAVEEEQDIVYLPDSGRRPAVDPVGDPPPEVPPVLHLAVDERFLFRFSALTYNAHRIHYDRDWARHEGYADLVVHGPLQALLMAELMRRNGVDVVGQEFSFRLVAPAVGPQRLTARPAEDGLSFGAEVLSAAGVVTATSQLGTAVR